MGIRTIIDLGDMRTVKWRLTYCCNYRCSYCIQKKSIDAYERTIAEDNERMLECAPEVNRIIEELGEGARNGVLLELIGGEATLLDLPALIERITSSRLKRLNMTTNFSRGADYFLGIYNTLKARGIEFSLIASLHTPQADIETFKSEVLKFVQAAPDAVFKCETVSFVADDDDEEMSVDGSDDSSSGVKSTDSSDALVEFCKANNIGYVIDSDISHLSDHQGEAKSMSGNKKPRYRVVSEEGDEVLIYNRNRLITGQAEEFPDCSYKNRAVYTDGFYCTRDYDFVYLVFDKHMGFTALDNYVYCKHTEPLADFHPASEPRPCPNHACSICGRMSISKDKDSLLGLK